MLSDFQRAKLDRRFELLDADGDGYLTSDDYVTTAANVCRAFDYPRDSAQFQKLHAIYQRLWAALSRTADGQERDRLSREQFAAAAARAVVEPEGGYDRLISPITLAVFDVIDGEGGGTLDIDELTIWFNAYGVCADDAERAFKALDCNGDGLLTAREVQQAIREFYTSDDPRARGNLIFGPLPRQAAAASANGASVNGASVDGSANGASRNGNGGLNGAALANGSARTAAAQTSSADQPAVNKTAAGAVTPDSATTNTAGANKNPVKTGGVKNGPAKGAAKNGTPGKRNGSPKKTPATKSPTLTGTE